MPDSERVTPELPASHEPDASLGSAGTLKKLADLKPDERNANRGTKRGAAFIGESLRRHGAGRSILVDRHGAIIAGNKTAEAAGAAGLEDMIVVQTSGDRLVAVQRMDLELDSPEARALAIADNRSSELSLDWDVDVLRDLAADGVDLAEFWSGAEMDEIGLTDPIADFGARTLAERFGLPPFSILDARQGYWQERKAAWLALGIESELGRGGGNGTPPHPPTVTQNPDGTLNYGGTAGQAKRFDRQRATASPGGSARPAADYSRRERGDGRGRPQ